MYIYLREEPEVVPGKEDDYAHAIRSIVFPVITRSSVLTLRPVGAFSVDPYYGAWPNFVLLWLYEDGFASYAAGRARRTPGLDTAQPSHDPAMVEYVSSAGQWRQRFAERILLPLDGSPLPTQEPASSGAILLEQVFTVTPGDGKAFARVIRAQLMRGMSDRGATLELFARSAGRPSEYTTLWSLPSWDAWAAFQSARTPDDEEGFLPGYRSLARHVTDVVERTLVPLSFSPLGGSSGGATPQN